MSASKIVIADDACFMRIILKDRVNQDGFTVVGEASNGIETLQVVKKCNPDILILDVIMPKMTGVEILPILKKNHPNMKIIMCSALHDPKSIAECIQLGASAFITKPYQIEDLVQTIHDVMS